MNEVERAVIEAARAWLKGWKAVQGQAAVITPDSPLRPLQDAVEALEMTVNNKPTGFIVHKPWSEIPAGWFVQAKPGGPWYEVLSTSLGAGQQYVTIRMPDGSTLDTQRPREDQVSCRAGSQTNPIGDAVQALGEGTEILEDRP